MEVLYERCCGLDIHKQTVVACLIVPGAAGAPQRAVRTFRTATPDLLQLGDWLQAAGCTHVAMESTGVYWQPIWNLREERFTLLLVNAHHVKAVPGRKSDVRDCEWLADLLRHGLVRGSFVPDRAQRELRELTRYRTTLVRERAREINRLQKTLEGANVKLASVVSDVTGVSARRMVEDLVAGATDAAALADLARGRLREKLPALEAALTGRVQAHQRFLLAQQLAHMDYLEEAIARVSQEIAARLRPHEADLERLETIPGVGRSTAEGMLAEIGPEMARFPTADHLASWAGMCPGQDESAGRARSSKTRKGNTWLRAVLAQAANGAARKRGTALQTRHRQIKARRGGKRAVVATGRRILELAYHVLKDQSVYDDAKLAPATEPPRQRRAEHLTRDLRRLGYEVTLSQAATP